MRQRPRPSGSTQSAGRSDQPERKVSPGIARAMRGLRGFAAQASGAYSKLKDVLGQLVPVVGSLGQSFVKMKNSLAGATTTATQAGAAFGRLRATMTAMVPVNMALTAQFGAMSKALVTLGGASSTAFGGMAAAAGRAAGSTGAIAAAMGGILAPLAGVAAVAGVAYVAIAKWESVPGILKPILVVASPLVFTIRAMANAFSLATLPIRTFKSVTEASLKAIIAPVRLLQTTVTTVARGVVAGVTAIGKAFLTLPTRFVLPSLGLIRKGLASLGSGVRGAVADIGSIATRVTEPIKAAGQEFADAAVKADDMAAKAGLAIENLGELGFAAEKSGSSVEQLVGAMTHIDGALEKWAANDSTFLESLGIDPEQFLAIGDSEQRFLALGSAIAALGSDAERTQAATAAFGDAGVKLLRMFDQGAAGLNNMRAEARRLGVVMGGDDVKAARGLSAAYATLKNATQGLWQSLARAVMPALTQAAQHTATMIAAVTNWTRRNQPLIAQLFKVASTAAQVAGTIAAVGAAAATVTPQLLALAGTVAAGWLAWTRYGETIKNAFGGARQLLASFVDETRRVMAGVWDAIEGGQLELAVNVAMAGAQKAWIEGLRLLAQTTTGVLSGIFNSLAAGDWQGAASQAWGAVQSLFLKGAGALDSVFVGLQDTIDAVITTMRQQLNNAIHFLAKFAADGVAQVVEVSKAVEAYDPTGLLQSKRLDLQLALQGIVSRGTNSPDAANAALAADAAGRRDARGAALTSRQEGRDAALAALSAKQLGAGAAAEGKATAAGFGVDARLADLLAKADAARAAVAGQRADDIARNGKLADVVKNGGGGGIGATFSAAALSAMGGRGNAQERAAKAAEAMAGKMDQLIVLEEKRQREAKAMEARWTA